MSEPGPFAVPSKHSPGSDVTAGAGLATLTNEQVHLALAQAEYDLALAQQQLAALVDPAADDRRRVLNERNQPLDGVSVRLYQEGVIEPVQQIQSGVGGDFSFSAQNAAGGVMASAEGYVTSSLGPGGTGLTPRAATAAGDTARSDITLMPVR